MRRGLKLHNHTITRLQNRQRGYLMITLMLAVALIMIALLTVLPEIKQQIKRDREEEMCHRGTAYMRAIQHYFKKYGSYPATIEQLESTNHLRFLRKRYTDPMNRDPATGKERDFKFLHQTDISLNNGPVLGTTPGPGGPQVQPSGLQPTGLQPPKNSDSGDSSSDSPSSGNPSAAEGNPNSPGSPSASNSSSNSSSGFNGPTFGGLPIIGVASTSKEKSIRVFYGKSRYKDWLFVYVAQADRGGLLTGPVNPGMPTPNLNGGNLNPVPTGGNPGPNAGQPQGFSTQPQQSPAPTSSQQ